MPGIGDTLGDMHWAMRDAAARGRTRYHLDRMLYNAPVSEALHSGASHAWDVLNNPTTTPDIRPGGYDIRMRTHSGGPNAALAIKALGGLGLGYGLYRGGKALHNYLTSLSEEKTGHDMYGFSEKVAHQLTDPEVDEVAWQHNMAGPGYGAEHFDPVQMGIVPASQAHRRFVGGLLGLGGAAVGAGAGGAGWGLPGMVAGAALGGLGGYQLGYHSTPNQLAMRRQPSPEDTQIEQKVGAFYGFSKKVAETLAPDGDYPDAHEPMSDADRMWLKRTGYGLSGAMAGGYLGYKTRIGPLPGALSGMNAGLLAAGANSPEQRRGDFRGLLRPLGAAAGFRLGMPHGIPKGIVGTFGGGAIGDQLGGALADWTQHRSPEDTQIEQKVGAFYGFSKEAAMAVPGLLQQMTSGAGRMGRAVNIAGQRALRGFDASRTHVGAGMMDSLRNAGTQGVNSLMNSQAGQNALMAGGAALGTGALAAGGYGAYRALRSPQQPAQQPQPLQR